MNILQALILSAVEGVTEFLPISSTGHLVLASSLLSIPQTEFVKSFEIIIQLGAILAVTGTVSSNSWRKYWKQVLFAFLPTGVLGLILYKLIKTYLLGNVWVTAGALAGGGIMIILIEKFKILTTKFQINSKSQISNLKSRQAIFVGLCQSVSMIPGVSRAMASIFGGMGVGLSREEATQFSFLLAVPTMAAATGLDLFKSGWSFSGNEWILLGAGFAGAFVTALGTVRWLMDYVKKHDFTIFGIYRIVLGLVFLLIS